MDPITTAIIAGVTASVTGDITAVGKKAIVDAYESIKKAVKSKFGKDSKLSKAITELEENPKSKGQQMLLAETMAMEKADQDPKLISIAEQLVQALNETEAGRRAVAKYQIDAKDAQIGVMGENAKVEGGIHFGGSKK